MFHIPTENLHGSKVEDEVLGRASPKRELLLCGQHVAEVSAHVTIHDLLLRRVEVSNALIDDVHRKTGFL